MPNQAVQDLMARANAVDAAAEEQAFAASDENNVLPEPELEKVWPPHSADKENFPPYTKWLSEVAELLPDVPVEQLETTLVKFYKRGVAPRDVAFDLENVEVEK